MIRIIVAEDHAVMRRGLRLVLEGQKDFQVVGEASDGREAVALAESLKPNVVVLDITMPNMNGIEAASQISAKQLGVSIVVLSMHSDEGYVLRALKAGARGYLLKESPEADFIQAIRSVIRGKAFFSPAVSRLLVEDYVRQLQDKDIEDSFFHVDTGEHYLAGRIFSPQDPLHVGLAGDDRCVAIHAYLHVGKLVRGEFALAGFERVYHLRLARHLAIHGGQWQSVAFQQTRVSNP